MIVVIPNSMSVPTPSQQTAHSLDTPEMIDRLAAEMRASSGADLPHAYFVEQVKLKLAGEKPGADRPANDAVLNAKPGSAEHPSAIFHAWALGER
jgi:hypothetical protein